MLKNTRLDLLLPEFSWPPPTFPLSFPLGMHFRVLHFHFNVTTHVFVVKAYGKIYRAEEQWQENVENGWAV